jgi:tetratricopeptide (TPR) repeat protein
VTTDRDARLPASIAVLIMVVSLVGAAFAYLQTQANNRGAIASRRAQAEAVRVLGHLTIQERDIAHQATLYGYASDLALFSSELGFIGTSGLDYASRLGSAYARGFTQSSSFSSVIGSEYQRPDGFVEWARFVEEQRRPVYRASEVQKAQDAVAAAWWAKGARYVAIITVLAAALFLLGLAANVEDARRILVRSGSGLALAAALWGVTVISSDVPEVSERSIEAYVDGFIINLWGQDRPDFVFAERRFNDALAIDPDYRDAYFGRGLARFQLDLLDPAGPQGSAGAEADFRKVLEYDDQNGISWGNLGAVRFWTGDYAGFEAATIRALELTPGEPIFELNLGLFTAIAGDAGAHLDQLRTIRENLAALPAWLRETAVFRYMLPLDLAELHRPEIAAEVVAYREQVLKINHEISVGRRFFGSPAPKPIDMAVPDLTLSANDEGTVIGAEFTYTGADPANRWLYRTYVDRIEAPNLSRVTEPWTLDVPDGEAVFEITYPPGLRGTTVRVEIFVEGNLLAVAEIAVP